MRYSFLLFCFILVSSCGVKKGVRYFEDIDKSRVFDNSNFPQLKYEPNDLIKIRVSSETNVGVAPFNLTENTYVGDPGIGAISSVTRPYLVKQDGTVDVPVLGNVLVEGKTREEVVSEIEGMLLDYIKEPRVEIETVNFNVSILGEVESPGTYNIKNERVTILEAIAKAGDLNLSGKRNNIYVLREEDNLKKFIKVNLLNDSLFSSPAFFLKQNDVVYVEQNKFITREASWESRVPFYSSIIAVTLTLYSLLFLR